MARPPSSAGGARLRPGGRVGRSGGRDRRSGGVLLFVFLVAVCFQSAYVAARAERFTAYGAADILGAGVRDATYDTKAVCDLMLKLGIEDPRTRQLCAAAAAGSPPPLGSIPGSCIEGCAGHLGRCGRVSDACMSVWAQSPERSCDVTSAAIGGDDAMVPGVGFYRVTEVRCLRLAEGPADVASAGWPHFVDDADYRAVLLSFPDFVAFEGAGGARATVLDEWTVRLPAKPSGRPAPLPVRLEGATRLRADPSGSVLASCTFLTSVAPRRDQDTSRWVTAAAAGGAVRVAGRKGKDGLPILARQPVRVPVGVVTAPNEDLVLNAFEELAAGGVQRRALRLRGSGGAQGAGGWSYSGRAPPAAQLRGGDWAPRSPAGVAGASPLTGEAVAPEDYAWAQFDIAVDGGAVARVREVTSGEGGLRASRCLNAGALRLDVAGEAGWVSGAQNAAKLALGFTDARRAVASFSHR